MQKKIDNLSLAKDYQKKNGFLSPSERKNGKKCFLRFRSKLNIK